MGIGGFLGNLFDPLGLFHSKGAKKDPYADLMNQLNPLIEQNKQITGAAGTAGIANIGGAKDDLNYVSKYLKSLLEGSDDNLLKLFDSSEITKGIDENTQQLSELGVRGGRRAAVLGQQNFDRDSSISRILSQLRFGAPDKIANVAQILGNLGLGELSASTGAGAQASNVLFGVEGLKQADKDRKTELIGSIFEAIGAIAGTAACVSIWGSHFYVPTGKIAANLLQVGDRVCSFTKEGVPVIREVIRIRTKPQQVTRIISNGNTIIRPTLTHEFCDPQFDKNVNCGSLESEDLLSIVNGKNHEIHEKPIKIMGEEKNDVIIVKLDNEEDSYPLIINGYICMDDDPLPKEEVK